MAPVAGSAMEVLEADATYETLHKGIEHRDPAILADMIVALIKATNHLLDRQLRYLEKDFPSAPAGPRPRRTRLGGCSRAA